MSLSGEELGRTVEEETQLFCQAEHDNQSAKGRLGRTYDDATLYSRDSNCGVATAFLQQRLRQDHDLETERLHGQPPESPRLQFNNRRFGHVILRQNRFLIDPTYGQLFSFAGVTAGEVNKQPESFRYPDKLALIVDTEEPEQALDPLVHALHAAAESEQSQQSPYAPFRGVGQGAIAATLRDLYNPDNYSHYQAQPTDPSHDHVQNILTRAKDLQP